MIRYDAITFTIWSHLRLFLNQREIKKILKLGSARLSEELNNDVAEMTTQGNMELGFAFLVDKLVILTKSCVLWMFWYYKVFITK